MGDNAQATPFRFCAQQPPAIKTPASKTQDALTHTGKIKDTRIKNPKVSVIIPLFNKVGDISCALTSVLQQDLRSFEIICVDDGSTDGSSDIVKHQAADDKRIVYIHQENAGAGAARNTGLDAAQGDYVTFLDADDAYETTSYLSDLYAGAHDHAQPAAAGNLVLWYGGTHFERNFLPYPAYAWYTLTSPGITTFDEYQFDYGFTRFLYDRALFAQGAHRFKELTFFEDPIFQVEILAQAGSFYRVPTASYLYRNKHAEPTWTTRQVCDLAQGVCHNLAFSREKDLANLHWYTVTHFNEACEGIDIARDTSLDKTAIRAGLERVEAAIDTELLLRADFTQPITPLELRRAFNGGIVRSWRKACRRTLSRAWHSMQQGGK